DFLHRECEASDILPGADHQGPIRLKIVWNIRNRRADREVHHRPCLLADGEEGIADHARNPIWPVAQGHDDLADRIFAGEILPLKRFADNDLGSAHKNLIIVKGVSALKGNAESREIAGVNPARYAQLTFSARQRRPALDGKSAVAAIAVAGERGHQSRGLNAG